VARVQAAQDARAVRQVGIEWACKQSLELLDYGVKNLHFYIMQNTSPFVELMGMLKKQKV